MQQYLSATLTLLAVINPVICGVMLLGVEGQSSRREGFRGATIAALEVLVILLIAAVAGKFILQVFGISLDVFGIVGGLIITYIGFSMLGGKSHSSEDGEKSLSSLVMFAASPGTIATVITLSVGHGGSLPLGTMISVALAILVTWLVMCLMLLREGHMKAGSQKAVSGFMGLILISMGLQFALSGLKQFMAS